MPSLNGYVISFGVSMIEKIDLDRFRQVLGSSCSDSQAESLRNRLYGLAEVLVDKVLEIKSLFVKQTKTICCKAKVI